MLNIYYGRESIDKEEREEERRAPFTFHTFAISLSLRERRKERSSPASFRNIGLWRGATYSSLLIFFAGDMIIFTFTVPQ